MPTELEVAERIRDGKEDSPTKLGGMSLFALRITGTGLSFRTALKEYVWRDKEIYLNEEFLRRCNGLPVIWEHPKESSLNSAEFGSRVIGTVFLPYILHDEVWGICRIYDAVAIQKMTDKQLSTSPCVVFQKTDGNKTIPMGESTLLVEGIPSHLDHLAVCDVGVWDKGGEATGVLSDSIFTKRDDSMPEEEEKKFDAAKFDSAMQALGNMTERMDAMEKKDKERADKERKDSEEKEAKEKEAKADKARRDAEEKEEKAKADAAAKADKARKDAESAREREEEKKEETERQDKKRKDAEEDEEKKAKDSAKADAAKADKAKSDTAKADKVEENEERETKDSARVDAAKKDRFSKRKDGESYKDYAARHDKDEKEMCDALSAHSAKADDSAGDKKTMVVTEHGWAKKARNDAEEEEKKADKDYDEWRHGGEEKGEKEAEKKETEGEEQVKTKSDSRADAQMSEVSELKSQIAALSAVVKQLTTETSPSDRDALAAAQSRADAVAAMFGERASPYMQGETPLAYRKRLLGKFQRHSDKFKDARFDSLDDAMMEPIEGIIYSDAQSAARSPESSTIGQLIPVPERDEGGRTLTRFVGDPMAWMAPFMSGGQGGRIIRPERGRG